ncbi:hypothetical protein O181_008823 [Austropuccinia psidii MF-1]|uniref:Uncharacterized protein n=1 Tax=Austropuccinia psidii MF-1 TaxID=1389203 RepID=A0A9Q3BQ65_9BASI|nr:hypothetical protein [Austropuccinia psidii MF-1]
MQLYSSFSEIRSLAVHAFLTEPFTSPNMIVAFPYAIRAALVVISVLMLCCASQPVDSSLSKRKVELDLMLAEDSNAETSSSDPNYKINMAHALPI